MELRRYLGLLGEHTRLIVICAIVGFLGGLVSGRGSTSYSATSTLYIGSRTIDVSEGSQDLSNDRNLAIATIAVTFSEMIDSEPIAARAIALTGQEIGAGDLVARTETTVIPGTQLLHITVTDADAATARDLANGLADGFVTAVQDFEPSAAEEGDVPTLPAYVFQKAGLPTQPLATGAARNAILGLILGVIAAVGLILVRDAVDVTVRSIEDAEEKLELPVLGAIPLLGSRIPPARDVPARTSSQ